MIDWTTIQAALKAWAGDRAGLPAVWQDEAAAWLGKAHVRLSITSSAGIGIDEVRYDQDEDAEEGADDMVPTFCGPRRFTLSVQVISRDQSPDKTARHYLEVLRTSLARPSVKAAFVAAQCSVASILAGIPRDRVVDGRWESVGTMDIEFNAVSNVTDTEEATSHISTVQISSTLSGTSVDLDDEDFGDT